jgi:hypothetical protein
MMTVVGSSCMARVTEAQEGYSQFINFVDHPHRLGIVGSGSGQGRNLRKPQEATAMSAAKLTYFPARTGLFAGDDARRA